MPRKGVKIPISSYDPRLKELLLRASREAVTILCTSAKQRTSLRNQLMNYRARARDEKLEFAEQLYRAKLSLGEKTPEGKYPLVVAPRGSEFNDILGGGNPAGTGQVYDRADPLADFNPEDK
jgi:hypothetical protein